MNPESLFETNLGHMSRFSKNFISDIKDADCSAYQFCETDLNEKNLKKTVGDEPHYFHSQRGAVNEAKQMFQEVQNLKKIQTIFVYGLGLGYFYDVAKKWLEENKNRYLIFLEDDFALIHRFLELPRATEMLTHPQVVVQAFKTPEKSTSPVIPKEFDWICWTFSRVPLKILVLNMYNEERAEDSELITLILNLRFVSIDENLDEIREEKIRDLYTNFYFNLYKITDAYRGQNMKNVFSSIPTLLCGAGPSLSKISDQIKELKSKALIIGAGTGMNVLNKLGIIPNFGGAIDPNEESINRIMTNYAYEVPFFYMNRFEYHALRCIHGPLIFFRIVTMSSIQEWFESELEITDSMAVKASISTTNYLLNVAQFLGCSPIALAGIDLAYTDKARYPKEIQARPLDPPLQERQLKSFSMGSGRVIPMKNADGEQIFSRMDWFSESESYSWFSRQFPDNKLFNVTKGGLPIPGVPNPSLQEFAEEHLQKEFDFINFVHASIQIAGKMPISKEKLTNTYSKWKKTLDSCSSLCLEIISVYQSLRSEVIKTGLVPSADLKDPNTDTWTKIKEEPAYKYYLYELIDIHKKLTFRKMHTHAWFPELFSEKEKFLKKLEFEETKAELINFAAKLQLDIIERVIHEDIESVPPPSKPIEKIPGDHYSIENGRLIIQDSELKLMINEPFVEKPFHGPSRFFSKEGNLLAEGWFYNGKRLGKNWQYYASGAFYSLQRFKEGEWHGKQEYFYENGQKKSIINYSHGLLDGKVELYHPNGVLAREIYFSEGKLHGTEKDWRPNGQQLSENQYDKNTPMGISRKWHANGVLGTEKVYYDSLDHYDLRKWDEQGFLIYEDLYFKDIGTELLQESKDRRQSLENLKKQLEQLKSKKKDA